MAITTVLFDLDGTLLPMDQEVFVKAYFGRLAQKLAPRGYEPERLIDTVWKGTAAMVKNTGDCTNEAAFWRTFAAVYGADSLRDQPVFDAFYQTDFPGVQDSCGYHPKAAEAVALCKERGFTVALATNPLFPATATEQRIGWAGLSPADFALYTTYENSHYCKPNPAYYTEVLGKLGVTPAESVMVGNDVGEDMIARTLGMQVFLLTDCLINKKNADISAYPHGGFEELLAIIRSL